MSGNALCESRGVHHAWKYAMFVTFSVVWVATELECNASSLYSLWFLRIIHVFLAGERRTEME